MKVLYLTWGETPRLAGVYKSQVINLISKFDKNIDINLISGLPIINSGFTREKFKYWKILKDIKKYLKLTNNSSFELIPILGFQTIIYPKKISYIFLTFFSELLLSKKIRASTPEIIHCRGYHSTNLAIKLRRKYNFEYKIIFDPRGLAPEEFILSRNSNIKSYSYRKLKQIEAENIMESDIILSVSDTMTEYYNVLGAKNVKTIFLSTNFDSVNYKKNIGRKNIDPNSLKFCYAGALDARTWHKPDLLIDLYVRLSSMFPESTLTIITNSNHQSILKLLPHSIKDKVQMVSCSTSDEVLLILKKCDIGLMSYMIPKSVMELKVANTVFAIKTVEYLASSIPVIVNKYCGGASKFLLDNNFGLVYDPNNLDRINKADVENMISNFDFEKCFEKRKLFSYEENINKYVEIYHELI